MLLRFMLAGGSSALTYVAAGKAGELAGGPLFLMELEHEPHYRLPASMPRGFLENN